VKNFAGYMARAPLSFAKMCYDAASGTVMYRFNFNLHVYGFSHHTDREGARLRHVDN